jgi:leucyl aminopeptidase
MEIYVKTGDIQDEKTELISIYVFEGVNGAIELSGAALVLDGVLGGQTRRLIAAGDFKGKAQETAVLYTNGAIPAERVLLVGLGQEAKFNLEALRVASAVAARRVRGLRINQFSTVVEGDFSTASLAAATQAIVEGSELALYRFRELKSKPDEEVEVAAMTLIVLDDSRRQEAEAAAQAAHEIVAGVNLARNLVNRPANYATPSVLAQEAQALADEVGLTCQILEEAEMAEMGMGSLLAVAQGTDEPAKLIILEHNAGRDDLDTVALVGKGITFDSGGISLKQPQGMEICKGDMAGGAAVLGTMRTVAALDLPLHVVGLVPATENLPGGKAYKPGDVVRAMNGQTIEVVSTDAEGRMILADALAYTARYRPRAIVDLATLTGSIVTALGHHAMGLFSNNDGLAARLETAGRASHERLWRLPLFEEYGEQLKSDIADVRHSGGQSGGAIVAAFFLSKFIDNVPWAHLDIVGQMSTDEDKPYIPKWATGVGVRLLTQFLRDWTDAPPAL